jgi:hypothetical protein
MKTTPKYKAKPVFWDTKQEIVIDSSEVGKYRVKNRLKLPEHITRFDSQHEFKVYLELWRMYGGHRIKRQYPIEVIPSGRCYPKGKHWKVDFAITTSWSNPEISHYVEAKGALLPEFVNTLVQLEIAQSTIFENLCVVFGRSIPAENKVIKTLLNQYFTPYFCTLEELEQLTHLPLPL